MRTLKIQLVCRWNRIKENNAIGKTKLHWFGFLEQHQLAKLLVANVRLSVSGK